MGRTPRWQQTYARRINFLDGLVIAWAIFGAHLLRFGPFDSESLSGVVVTEAVPGLPLPYWLFGCLLFVTWWLMLGAWGSRQTRVLGSGPEEYKRVAAASLWLFGLIATFSYLFRVETARGYVGIALPIGLTGLLVSRWLLRQHLSIDRQGGRSMSRLLLVGGPSAVAHLAASLRTSPHAGYLPIAAYTPGANASHHPDTHLDLPVMGVSANVATIVEAIKECGADAVAVSAGVQLHPQTLRHLGWELAAQNISLIMAPALTDVAGPRIHTRPVAGLPLIHVTTPSLEGGQRVAKRLFDIVISGALITLAAPLMMIVAVVVRFDSKGPVLFRQQRVGMGGNTFHMLKFRSMVVDAERQLSVLSDQNEGSGVLFKIKNDPRITRVGRYLRRYSVDELPQLFNIFAGSMSLVGPRPPLPQEVEAYERDVRRRLLVKPGLTGLWQVSGRSDLSWQDSVRLDLYYVENWSLAGDLVILLRTIRAVFRSAGAY
ncbi:sugar transferase [Arthrobacter sp. NicSoilB11]|uniref:sugar transferase n=1 Tax=Arthrobacter sp. NicSoilB11 TaxID=2830999 RepID=UPI001CC38FC8|nr:sugar transferase [Arthrobacter sp. NicSoilB11]